MAPPHAARRPRSVMLTFWGLILLGGWNAARVFALVRQIGLLLALDVGPDPRIRLIFAVLWSLLFWATAVALWQKRPFSRYVIPLLLILFALYEFSLIALFVGSPAGGALWLRRVLAPFITILFVTWALNRHTVTHYFQKERTARRDVKRP